MAVNTTNANSHSMQTHTTDVAGSADLSTPSDSIELTGSNDLSEMNELSASPELNMSPGTNASSELTDNAGEQSYYAAAQQHNTPLVRMTGITKTFVGVKALQNVDLCLYPGEVLALLGENGAGKSTLMNVLGGVFSPDEGSIEIEGVHQDIRSVKDSQSAGIAFVHQELALEPYLSVAENLFLGREITTSLGMVSKRLMNQEAKGLLQAVGLDVSPEILVAKLSNGQQQMIEIAKALSLHSKVIVLDEPTSSLSEKEVQDLFRVINTMRSQGIGIIYISHKMSELFTIADRVMVMRDGTYIDTVNTSDITEDELIAMMVGREMENYYYRTFHDIGDVVLSLENYIAQPWNTPINLSVRHGEILGFYGLIGAGRSELWESVMGLRAGTKQAEHTDSRVQALGNDITHWKSQKIQAMGMALVPENRKVQGVFLFDNVRFNTTIASLQDFMNWGHVNVRKERSITQHAIDSMNVKTPSMETRVGTLSGGNQQKVVLGKWLATHPKILILDEPTRGIDVGAKAEIYRIIDDLAAQGVTIILISSELNEVMNMSDRLAIMRDGAITKILDRSEYQEDTILRYAIGA